MRLGKGQEGAQAQTHKAPYCIGAIGDLAAALGTLGNPAQPLSKPCQPSCNRTHSTLPLARKAPATAPVHLMAADAIWHWGSGQ